MKKNILLILVFISGALYPGNPQVISEKEHYPAKVSPVKEKTVTKKKIAKPEEKSVIPKITEKSPGSLNGKCCEIFRVSRPGSLVMVNYICINENETEVQLELLRDSSVCIILENIILTDNDGYRYSPISHTGLPDCGKGGTVISKASDKIIWRFEKLKEGVKWMKMQEKEIPEYPSYWSWDTMELNKCRNITK
ncbi:MAG: hypothetical protein K8R21_06075 [Leptospira sp.]|nr:hypothetical protein [Leptospira sp.]